MKSSQDPQTYRCNSVAEKLNSTIQNLKVCGTEDLQVDCCESHRRSWEGDQVRVRLKELLPVLLQAAVDQSAWLNDFEDETIVISKDFHELLSIFQQMRKSMVRAA